MQLELLESFDTPSLEMPARSKLVSLRPQAIGTPYCEGLISYITRLAYAHMIGPQHLVQKIIAPIADIHLETSMINFSHGSARTINSYMRYADRFSDAITTLTQQEGLKNLTLLPWRDLLDPKGSGLLREYVAVCPKCLDQFSAAKAEIYYPLIWYLRAARICIKHHCRLEDTCPSCGKCQIFVGRYPTLGYCTHCGAWLGTSAASERTTSQMDEISVRDTFMTAAIEEMIAYNSTAEQFVSHKLLVDRVDKYCQHLTSGKLYQFGKYLGFSQHSIASWKTKMVRPRLDTFLELCFRLGQMPLDFLTAEIPADLAYSVKEFPKVPTRKKPKVSQDTLEMIRKRLEKILEGVDHPSQPVIAKTIGVKISFLLYHFPELCRAIADKRRKMISNHTMLKRAAKIEKAKAITESMFTELRPISRRKIGSAMEKEGLTFADRETRRAALEVLSDHQPSNVLPSKI